MAQGAQVTHVLHGEGLIQAVEPLEVGTHRGRERLLLIERAARCEAQDEKGDADDDEQRGNKAGEAAQRVAQHAVDFR